MLPLFSLLVPAMGFLSFSATLATAAAVLQRRDPTWAPAEGGCWTDSVRDRALSRFMGSHADLTPAKCQLLCQNEGFSLAGVEYAHECFCGNAIMYSNHPESGICNMPCSGDSSQTCGGPNAINIYVKDNFPYTSGFASLFEFYNGYQVTGCWQDSISNRVLKHIASPPIPGDLMTVQKCIDACAASGYTSAGLEYGRECWCDNVTYPPSLSASISDCDRPCTLNANQLCGGPDRIMIYRKTTENPPQ